MSEIALQKPALPNSCGGCPARWSGTAACHCGSCHHTFSGVSYFDQHRRNGECRDPETVGLVLKNRAYEVWASPEERPSGTYTSAE